MVTSKSVTVCWWGN